MDLELLIGVIYELYDYSYVLLVNMLPFFIINPFTVSKEHVCQLHNWPVFI
jgi:hypothetical protein